MSIRVFTFPSLVRKKKPQNYHLSKKDLDVSKYTKQHLKNRISLSLKPHTLWHFSCFFFFFQIFCASSYVSVRKIPPWLSHIIHSWKDRLRVRKHMLIFTFLEENKLALNLRACSEVIILEERSYLFKGKIQKAHYFCTWPLFLVEFPWKKFTEYFLVKIWFAFLVPSLPYLFLKVRLMRLRETD